MTTSPHTLTLPWVKAATQHFVYADRMREAISLAIASGLGLLFSGPGGHGKSEFLEAVFAAIKDIDPFVKSLGVGTTDDDLFGGIDLDALNRASGASLRYNTDNSFMPHHVVVFEEIFDAPPRVLAKLKDTLTARRLRNGAQRVELVSSVIVGATNLSPQEVAEGGPAIAALVERFPIQLEVAWSSYRASDYELLFTTVNSNHGEAPVISWEDIADLRLMTELVEVPNSIEAILAYVLAELRREGVTVSPRTAMMAYRLVKAVAVINDRTSVLPDDVLAVGYLPGCQNMLDRILEMIAEKRSDFEALAAIEATHERLKGHADKFNTMNIIGDLDAYNELRELLSRERTEATRIRVNSSLTHKRNELINAFEALQTRVNEAIDDIKLKQLNALIAEFEAEFERVQSLAQLNALERKIQSERDRLDGEIVSNSRRGPREQAERELVALGDKIFDRDQELRTMDELASNKAILNNAENRLRGATRAMKGNPSPMEVQGLIESLTSVRDELSWLDINPLLQRRYDDLTKEVNHLIQQLSKPKSKTNNGSGWNGSAT